MTTHGFQRLSMEDDGAQLVGVDRNARASAGIQHVGRDIIAMGLLTLIPMLVICGLLVGVTFGYTLDQNNDWFRSVDYPDASSDTTSYYLSISATNYVTISTWASNVSSSLTSFVMILFSFLVARRFSQLRSTEIYYRPTPFQLSLFLQAKSGSLGSFWSLAKYMRWRKRERLAGMVVETYLMLFTILVLSYCIWAADTWLHLSTKATLLFVPRDDSTTFHNYGRHLNCYNNPDPESGSCSTGDGRIWMVTDAFQTLNNLSSKHVVYNLVNQNQNFAYLTDASIQKGLDFEADTFAVSTSCKPLANSVCSVECNGDGSGITFDCPGGINGSLYTEDVDMGSIATALMFAEDAEVGTPAVLPLKNPTQFMVAALSNSYNSNLGKTCDGGAFGQSAWMLSCNATAYELSYRYKNGTATPSKAMELANDTIAATFTSAFRFDIGQATLFNAASTAMGDGNLNTVASSYAQIFSQTAVALAAGVFQGSANLHEAGYISGAKVEKAPFFTLLALVLIYIGLSAILISMALFLGSQDAHEIQARLTVEALAAQCFESSFKRVSQAPELFTEYKRGISGRIDIVKTLDGGMKYKVRSRHSGGQ